jgi:hypothetical protein
MNDIVFWNVTSCSLVETWCIHFRRREAGSSKRSQISTRLYGVTYQNIVIYIHESGMHEFFSSQCGISAQSNDCAARDTDVASERL